MSSIFLTLPSRIRASGAHFLARLRSSITLKNWRISPQQKSLPARPVSGGFANDNTIRIISAPKKTDALTLLQLKQSLSPPPFSRSLHALLNLQHLQAQSALHILQGATQPRTQEMDRHIDFLNGLIQSLETTTKITQNRLVTREELKQGVRVGKDMSEFIEKIFKKNGMNASVARRTAKEEFKKATLHLLNNRPWETIHNEFTYGDKTFLNTLTPAGQMKLGTDDIFKLSYQNKGISSASTREVQHATNLWLSEIAEQQPDAPPRILFSGLRHGILSPYGFEKDDIRRTDGAINRAKEVVSAALFLDKEKLAEALNGTTVTLRLSSTSLVTATNIGGFKEGQQLADQMYAWKTLSSKPYTTLTIRDEHNELKTVRVKLEVAAFNFGVNEAALKLGVFGLGHKTSDRYNAIGLAQLLGSTEPNTPLGGWVGEYLQKNPGAHNTYRVITLAEQLREIWTKKLHHTDGGEPYKAVQRIALLSHEIGVRPCWNCKSGKDRGSWAGGEIGREAVAMSQSKHGLPTPLGQLLPQAQQQLLRDITLRQGPLNQTANTGAPGNKVIKHGLLQWLIGPLSFTKRIGNNRGVSDEIQGLSTLIKS
ncbi:MAG: hypothetical protein IT497_06670 [Ottowia sp.]|nr:hypothetical protein [Ottowia sp.]